MNHLRKILFTIMKAFLVLISLLIVGVLGLFFYGLAIFPDIEAPIYKAPQTYSDLLWAEVHGEKPIPDKSLGFCNVSGEIFSEIKSIFCASPIATQTNPESILAFRVSRIAMWSNNIKARNRFKLQLAESCGRIFICAKWTPNQMLAYLSNNQYFGHQFYGIGAASQGYFGLPPEKLTPVQIALLVAIEHAPHRYDPWCAQEEAFSRVNNFILNRKTGLKPVTNIAELKLKQTPFGACDHK